MNMVRRDLPNQAAPRSASNAPAANTAGRPGMAPAAPQRPGAPQQAGGRHQMMAGGRQISPTAKADELAMVIRQLTELLTKENTALKKHKMEEVKALTERKEQLARLYQGHMNAVHKDPNILKALDPTRRNVIVQAAMKLGELMAENASLLKANIESINLFFKSVTEALKNRHEERSAAYSRSGALGQYAVTKRSLAVSYNQTM